MALKITYLGGGEAGRGIEFGDDKEEVRFGRGLGADVGFPEEMTLVSREHFGLHKEYGGYKFIINPEKPVFMDGRPLYDDQALPRSAEVQLGTPDGPRLRIERIDSHGSNQAKTEILKPQRELAHDMRSTAARGNRTLGLVAGVIAIVAVLGAGGYFVTQALRQDVTTAQGDIATIQNAVSSISTDIPAVKAELARIAESNFDASAIIAKNKESVYLIRELSPSGRELTMGTASVVLLPDGRKALATNAHIGALFADLSRPGEAFGGKLVAVQSKAPDYAVLQVVGTDIHPGYEAYGQWTSLYLAKVKAMGAQPLGFRVPGYDVALLYVSEPEKLGPPLTYATREEMNAMQSGDPLILIGFPAEGLNGTDAERPEPTAQSGRITSMTTFYFSTGKPDDNQLVQHSVPATGGASGSPMFNAKGELVAFLNSGNMTRMPDAEGNIIRVPSSALVNYAQRADLLVDLAEGKTTERMADVKRLMAEADAHLSLSPEKQLEEIMEVLASIAGGKDNVKLAAELEGVMATPIQQIGSPKTYVQDLHVDTAGIYAFVLQSEDGRPVLGGLTANGKFILGEGVAPITFVFQGFKDPMGITFLGIDFNGAISPDASKPDGKIKVKIYQLPLPKDPQG